jgi:GMP synthase-like glutamine amidotransferase
MKKLLIINNDSDSWQDLLDTARDAGFEVATLHCKEVDADSAKGYDAVILSGGWWYDDEIQHLESYHGELDLLRTTEVPTLGICLGMQLMQMAHTGQVQLLDAPQHDLREITVEPAGRELLGWPETVTVHKNHTMGAIVVAPGFDVLGRSPGHIEIIKHHARPLLGVQFHPEIGEKQARADMFRELVMAAESIASQPVERI